MKTSSLQGPCKAWRGRPAPYLPFRVTDRRVQNRTPIIVADENKRDRGPLSLHAVGTAFAVVTVAVAVVLFTAYHTCAFDGCPDVETVQGYTPDEASVVVDRDGEEIDKLYRVNRVVVELDELPTYVPQAFIATEDQEFYGHGGVDWTRALGALWQNVRSGEIEEGFSTISMQVARNVFPERLPVQERTLNRKISEIKVARLLEGRYTKDEILALYLNQIYFGSGAWGIEAAAQEYFGKPAADLELGEAALLAGLPQAPSALNPRQNMEGALERRETVLRRMRDEGFITVEQTEEIRDTRPTLSSTRRSSVERAAYFIEVVRQRLQERLGDDIYTQGYTIHTTLDLGIQGTVERELEQQLLDIEAGSYGYYPRPSFNATNGSEGRTSPYLQGAAVVMAAGSGDVLALVGGRDFDDSEYNRALQARRQPGSAFKPFVYAAALQNGLPPTTVLHDTPYTSVRDGQRWSPRNYGDVYAGEITMRNALVRSKNVATIRLAEQVGLDRVVRMAERLGLEGDIPRYPSVAIGAAEVSLMEMVTAYATFATLGERPQPRYITRVTDREGNLVWRVSSRSRRVLDPDIAFVTLDLMRDVIDRGTGSAVRTVGYRQPAAGKTGTTNESADVWFVGFTPRTVAGIWIGMDDPEQIMPRATGGRLAAPVWGRVMRQIGQDGTSWSPPSGVEQYRVDARGNVLAADCPVDGEPRQEYFLRGTVRPTDCFGYLGPDSLRGDSLGRGDDSWWRNLRHRLFGEEEEREGRARRDTLPREPDTTRARPDTIILETPAPDTTRSDTTRSGTSRSDTARTDSIRRDTARDTTRLRPTPPDTTPRPLPADSLEIQPRDTVPPDSAPPDTVPRPGRR